jgi:hypothetical protein
VKNKCKYTPNNLPTKIYHRNIIFYKQNFRNSCSFSSYTYTSPAISLRFPLPGHRKLSTFLLNTYLTAFFASKELEKSLFKTLFIISVLNQKNLRKRLTACGKVLEKISSGSAGLDIPLFYLTLGSLPCS